MRSSLIILILLAATACTHQQVISQTTNIPIPVAYTSDTPIDSNMAPITSMPACSCPTSIDTPVQTQSGLISHSPIICNCPAILVRTLISATGDKTNPQTIPARGITLADNGKTFIMHPGESFLLNLGIDSYAWTIDIDNQKVLGKVNNAMVIRGAQGIYKANSLGQVLLTAIGNPLCRNLIPECAMPSVLFKVTVIVVMQE